jgi:phage terminase large subunit GpA-like protein
VSLIHEVICNKCGTKNALKWNGEHWLFPLDWVELIDSDAYHRGHFCEKCIKKFKIKLDEKQ